MKGERIISNSIEVIFQDQDEKIVEDYAIKSILNVSGLRYVVVENIQNDISFLRIHIDGNGDTQFHDITDHHEFDLVKSYYQQVQNESTLF